MKNMSSFKISAMIIIGGLLFFAYEIYDFNTTDVPRLESETARLESQNSEKQRELRKLQEFAQNIDKIKQDLHEINLQLESALEHMPRTFNLSELLRKLNLLAENSGIDLASFRPRRSNERKENTFYSTISIEFDIRGTFAQTLVFFDQLSRLKRIVNIETLSMKAIDVQKSGPLMASTQAVIRTYRFTE